jgi:hypothetical protein
MRAFVASASRTRGFALASAGSVGASVAWSMVFRLRRSDKGVQPAYTHLRKFVKTESARKLCSSARRILLTHTLPEK